MTAAAEVCTAVAVDETLCRCANPACDKTFKPRSNKDCCSAACRLIVKRLRDKSNPSVVRQKEFHERITIRRRDRDNPHFIALLNRYVYAKENDLIDVHEVGVSPHTAVDLPPEK